MGTRDIRHLCPVGEVFSILGLVDPRRLELMSRNVGKQLPAYAAPTNEKSKTSNNGQSVSTINNHEENGGGGDLPNLLPRKALSYVHNIHG